MKELQKDVRLAVRSLKRSPTFTMAALLSLALGIGINVTIFTFVNSLLLRPLPVEQPGQLVALYSQIENNERSFGLSYPNYLDLREQLNVFDGIQLHTMFTTVLRGELPERIRGHLTSANYFEVLGVEAAHGRTFLPEEGRTPGTHPVVVLSHALWERALGADPEVVGQSIDLDGQSFTVVGIAPESFRNLGTSASPDIWVPLMAYPLLFEPDDGETLTARNYHGFTVVGRLAPGVSIEQARAAVAQLGVSLREAHPVDNESLSLITRPLSEVAYGPERRQQFLDTSRILMAIVFLVLLIACVNVANLLLVRASLRRRDTGVRIALGASRGALLRTMLSESLLLTGGGAVLGLLFAWWARNALWKFRPPRIPDDLDLTFDIRVFAFAFGVAAVVGIVFGLVGILQARRVGVAAALRERGNAWEQRRGTRSLPVRQLMLALQVAFTVIALVAAGLFIQSLRNSRQIDTGFRSDNVLLVSFNVQDMGYSEAAGQEFFREVSRRVEALPGVVSASVASRWAFGNDRAVDSVELIGRELPPELETMMVRANQIQPGYLQTLDIPLLRGRDFDSSDSADSRPVAIVNKKLADLYWPGENPLGQLFRYGDSEPLEVVGVAVTAMYNQLDEEPQPYIYLPLTQSYSSGGTLHVQTRGAPEDMIEVVRQEVGRVDDKLPTRSPGTMFEVIDRALWAPRLGAGLLSLFGLLALLLAGIGIYGVLSYLVSSSRREIGVRMAIGARRRDVLLQVLGAGMRWLGVGLVIGLVASAAGYAPIADLLYDIDVGDRARLAAGVSLVLVLVGLLACLVPAWRSTRLDPVTELRTE